MNFIQKIAMKRVIRKAKKVLLADVENLKIRMKDYEILEAFVVSDVVSEDVSSRMLKARQDQKDYLIQVITILSARIDLIKDLEAQVA